MECKKGKAKNSKNETKLRIFKHCVFIWQRMCGFYLKVWLLSSPLGLTMPWLGLWLTTSLMSCLTSKFATGWVSNNVTRCCKHSCETTTTHIYRKYCWPCRTSTQIGRSRPRNIHQTLRNRSVGTKKTKISLFTKISPIFAFLPP